MTPFEVDLRLPRNAFGPRDTARAADLWRAAQDAALAASTDRGWPPQRYRAVGSAFVIRALWGVHHREITVGDAVRARTWVADFRRDVFTARHVQLLADGVVAFEGVQEWVHVSMPDGRMVRAPPELSGSFEVGRWAEPPSLPDLDVDPVPPNGFNHDVWHIAMDPLGHLNHAATVDLAEEAVARAVAAEGMDPASLSPVAERVSFRLPVKAPDRIEVLVVGRRGPSWAVEVRNPDGRVAAEVALVRVAPREATR